MLLLLTASISNRLRYIADLMFCKLLGIEARLTISTEEFAVYQGPKISYSREPMAEGPFIEASGLLFETNISFQEVIPTTIDGVSVIFASGHPLSALPFDPFAAAFYMVTRYEEYHPFKKDTFGRFPATESIAWKGGFLDVPIVHLWAEILKRMLSKHYQGLKFLHPRYRFTPTIDIDHAWCYLGRPLSRTLGGFGRSVIHGRFGEVTGRLKVLTGWTPDPYDNYIYLNMVHRPHENFPLFFILFADYGRNDNNVTVTSKNFHKLLMELDQQGTVGIHPSLSSNKHPDKLEDEYEGLCEVLDRDVTISRQHFLKLSLPRTYRNLLHFGITDDYSMGYASHTGFRAGIAVPFAFFDLARNEVTPLVIHPVSLMDVTMMDYLRLNKVESMAKIENMIQTIRSVHGEFVSLWHNESLGDTGRWKGWREVYEEMVKLASS